MVEQVEAYIRERGLMKPGDRVGVAVSGGADSVALLRVLLELREELGIVLSVAHFNHRIRGEESDADEYFSASLARDWSLDMHSGFGDTPVFAKAHKLSLETAARRLRYDFFQKLLGKKTVHKIATAHTLDDQAETVLMRTVRGAGTRGVAAIHPLQAGGAIVRPLLQVRRAEVVDYLEALQQEWREDPSNRAPRHLRNRVRHQLLPLLEREFNPSVARVLADAAEVARAEEEYWDAEIAALLPSVLGGGAKAERDGLTIKAAEISKHPVAVQRRIVRALAARAGIGRLDFQHIAAVVELAGAKPKRTAIELPGGWKAQRRGAEVRVERAKAGA